MGRFSVYRLEPRGPFHFGDRGVGLETTAETVRSDALFSALCSVTREFHGPEILAALLAAFQSGAPPFLLSSAFPYAATVRFFPRPRLPLPNPPPVEAGKRLKRTRYVSEGILKRWLAGDTLADELAAGNFLGASGAWVTRAEGLALAPLLTTSGGVLWEREAVPRVAIDRRTGGGAIWRRGRLSFQAGCGLYFLMRWDDEQWRAPIETALAVLGDAGLGGGRAQGYGQFTMGSTETLDWDEPVEPDAWLTLALYWPTPDELAAGALDEPARYDLVARQGWVGSPEGSAQRRREVWMVAEGSLLAPIPLRGGLVEVTPVGFTAHPVYRHGLAFPLGVRRPAGAGHG